MENKNMRKVDVAYINSFLKEHGIAKYVFSESLGYDKSWWNYVKRSGGRVRRNVVDLMCSMYHMDADKIILKDPEPIPEPVQANLENDHMRALLCTMVRIEQKLNILLEKM